MQKYQNYARSLSSPGTLVASATITVYDAGTPNIATIYDDNLATPTPKSNPFTTDANGYFYFYAPNNTYDVKVSGGTPAITTYTFGDVPFGVGLAGVKSYTFATLPTAGSSAQAGRLARITDSNKNLWMDTGTQWVPVGPFIDVKSYGAKGDGATNDTAAIQAAFDAAQLYGMTLYVSPGRYMIHSTITVTMALDRSLTVLGNGRGNGSSPYTASRFILAANLASATTPMLSIVGGLQNGFINFRGIELRNDLGFTGSGLKATNCSAAVSLEHCWFQLFNTTGAYGAKYEQVIGTYLAGCHFETCDIGFQIGSTSGQVGEGTITACKFGSCVTTAVDILAGAQILNFNGNTFYGPVSPSEGIGVRASAAGTTYAIGLYQNSFENATPAILGSAATNWTEWTIENNVFNPRNPSGAGTKYGIDMVGEIANSRIQNNVFSGGCAAGGTLVGIRITTLTNSILGPNRFTFDGLGTKTNYSVPDGAVAVHGISTTDYSSIGIPVPILQQFHTKGYTNVGMVGMNRSVANNGTLTYDSWYAGLVVVRAFEYGAIYAVSGGPTPVTQLISDNGGGTSRFSIAQGTASKVNCYFTGGNFTIENRLGMTIDVNVVFIGYL